MVTINENNYIKKVPNSKQEKMNIHPTNIDIHDPNDSSAFNPNTFMHFKMKPSSDIPADEEIKLSDYIIEDVPLLMSDNEEMSDDESSSSKNADKNVAAAADEIEENVMKPSKAAEEVKKSMKEQENQTEVNTVNYDFKLERKQLMTIIVKYVCTKITNSFPPDTPHKIKPGELPLDKFLLILVSRLNLSLPSFMRGIIYLFRYMDIIYLLRYLNQSNNFANYNEMDFGLKKLIVGCFKLTLIRERKNTINWYSVTQLPNGDINGVVKTIVKRLNGKLLIKDIELVKLKLEIFRFVKMVTNRV